MPRKPQPHLSPAIYPFSQSQPIYTPLTARSYCKVSGVGAWWCRASLAPWTRGARGSRDGCRTRASLAGGSGASGLRMVRFVFGFGSCHSRRLVWGRRRWSCWKKAGRLDANKTKWATLHSSARKLSPFFICLLVPGLLCFEALCKVL